MHSLPAVIVKGVRDKLLSPTYSPPRDLRHFPAIAYPVMQN